MRQTIIDRCGAKAFRMTGQLGIAAQVPEQSDNRPDAGARHTRARAIAPKISRATMGRTFRRFGGEIEARREKIAARLGCKLKRHRPELFGIPAKPGRRG